MQIIYKGFKTTISNVLSLTNGKLILLYTSNNSVIDLRIGNERVQDKIGTFLSKTHFGPAFVIDPAIVALCNDVFDFADSITTTLTNPSLAAGVVDHLFSGFTLGSIPLMQVGANNAASTIWIQVCREVWKWESAHPRKIHKGTPYYFLGGVYLLSGNLDAGFLLVHNAIKEDVSLATVTGNTVAYKKAPAYMFASLIDDPHNFLFDLVTEMKQEVEKYILLYSPAIATFDFPTFSSKFLQNSRLEEEKFMFIYNLETLIQQGKLSAPELVDNEFSRLRNLDVIFNLCLIVDKVLQEHFGNDLISQNVIDLCREANWINQNDLETVRTQIGFNDPPDMIVPKLLSLNLQFNGSPLRLQVSCMLLTWRLRNYGGHNLKGQNIFVSHYWDIIRTLVFALFIAISKL
jgi:hypothetical protein